MTDSTLQWLTFAVSSGGIVVMVTTFIRVGRILERLDAHERRISLLEASNQRRLEAHR